MFVGQDRNHKSCKCSCPVQSDSRLKMTFSESSLVICGFLFGSFRSKGGTRKDEIVKATRLQIVQKVMQSRQTVYSVHPLNSHLVRTKDKAFSLD